MTRVFKRTFQAAFAGLFAGLALWLSATSAFSQTTTNVSTSWVSLGYGPMSLVAPGATAGAAQFAISDTTPTASSGTPIPPAYGVVAATTHKIWAIAPGASSPIGVVSTPIVGQVGVADTYVDNQAASSGGASETNYALETGGNLATVASAQGAGGSGISQPSGGSGLLGWLSGIYSKLSGTITVSSATQGSLSGGTAASNSQAAGGVYNSSAPSLTNGQQVALQLDAAGRLITNPANAVLPASTATSQASVSTSSGSTIAFAARAGAPGAGRVSADLYNVGSQTAYVGASGVTSSNGLPILPGGSASWGSTAAVYAVTASGSTTLAIKENY